MTRQQKKAVRKALRQYGRKQKAADAAGCAAAGPDPWGRVIRQVLDYYAEVERSNPNPNHCPLGHLWRRFHRK